MTGGNGVGAAARTRTAAPDVQLPAPLRTPPREGLGVEAGPMIGLALRFDGAEVLFIPALGLAGFVAGFLSRG